MNNNRFSTKPLAILAVPMLLTACMTTPQQDDSSSLAAVEYTQAWFCDGLNVETSATGENMELYVHDRSIPLQLVVSASGSKYQSATQPTTVFWSKANEAHFELEGQQMPLCYAAGHVPLPLTAQGNEPSWQVQLNNGHLNFSQLNGGNESNLVYKVSPQTDLGQRYTAKGAKGNMRLTVTNKTCSDTMTGMPYPYTAQFDYNGQQLEGCAGSPNQVLRGVEWYIQEINGNKIDMKTVRFSFLPNGEVTGFAGCNNFFGQYQLTGEGIKFSQFGATRMACEPKRMDIEDAVFSIFSNANEVTIDAAGMLTIAGSDGHIRAIAQ
ncbi:META domain-containing protein [Aliidiomarina quisquiliarum]|uniref:META domain-containing protein n=1 Tax=Aliidiomarina quisquiliarum TaxID=2938947 RepID=UPI00208E7B36|nr:META domain-containing protein [Aliidiomarina quisquiliarum]MCO4321052.1 META domain-containing protein [Aliidiomarina quisquiliarum]